MADWDLPCDPLLALQAGDTAPFERFVRSHARLLHDFFRRQGADAGQAEDLAQEVFLRLFDSAPRYRPESRLRPLVYRVARNAWIDARRRASTRGLPPRGEGRSTGDADSRAASAAPEWAPEPASERPGPEQRAIVGEEAARLRAALHQLSEAHRSVFELSVLEGLDHSEIAAVLDIPAGTVKSRLFYALRRLRAAATRGEAERE